MLPCLKKEKALMTNDICCAAILHKFVISFLYTRDGPEISKRHCQSKNNLLWKWCWAVIIGFGIKIYPRNLPLYNWSVIFVYKLSAKDGCKMIKVNIWYCESLSFTGGGYVDGNYGGLRAVGNKLGNGRTDTERMECSAARRADAGRCFYGSVV